MSLPSTAGFLRTGCTSLLADAHLVQGHDYPREGRGVLNTSVGKAWRLAERTGAMMRRVRSGPLTVLARGAARQPSQTRAQQYQAAPHHHDESEVHAAEREQVAARGLGGGRR